MKTIEVIPISLNCCSMAWCTRFKWFFSASLSATGDLDRHAQHDDSMTFSHLFFSSSVCPLFAVSSTSISSFLTSSGVIFCMIFLIACVRTGNHPGVCVVASSKFRIFAISSITSCRLVAQIISVRFGRKLFDFRATPRPMRQLFEHQTVNF